MAITVEQAVAMMNTLRQQVEDLANQLEAEGRRATIEHSEEVFAMGSLREELALVERLAAARHRLPPAPAT